MKYDFGGWATRNNTLCADGLTIAKDAFKVQDGAEVPLVWNHNHNSPNDVLGLAHLENRDDGVYAYCEFNDTESGKTAKELVKKGNIRSLSIMANKLVKAQNTVIHGMIREVSLVIAGANPGAFIDTVITHGDNDEDGLIVGYDENVMLYHVDEESEKSSESDNSDDEETIGDVIDTMSEKQKNVMYAMIAAALDSKDDSADDEDEEESEEGENTTMKHNVFDTEQTAEQNVLTHSAQMEIIENAKRSSNGKFSSALAQYIEDNMTLSHAASVSGFDSSTVDKLFPEYEELRPGAPELITYDQGWVNRVLSNVHKSPMSRIRTSQIDIRKYTEEIRAKGYVKGNEKKISGNISLVRRTTDPQTVYVKNALHKDDIADIVDFDYVSYMYNIDRMQLNEELATAIMIGDQRADDDEGKIFEEHIRSIWNDDELYSLHKDLDIATFKTTLQGTNTAAYFGDNFIYTEAIIETLLNARHEYKGSGKPDFYCTSEVLSKMLMARDMNGRRIYNTVAELASTLNVSGIYEVEQFSDKVRTTTDGKSKQLLGIIVNLTDYNLGSTKGGQITHFTQFDIDFNLEKSLLETRCSGALTRLYSAIVLEEDVTAASTVG